MEYRKYSKHFCLLILLMTMFAVYVVFHNRYTFILKSLNILFTMSNKSIDLIRVNISTTNRTNNSIFQSYLSHYYPHLPIRIFTQDLSLIDNTSKLILIGNNFFGNRNWDFVVPGSSSTQTMTSLFCPFLSDRCDITTDYNRFSEADAVVYHMFDAVNLTQAKEKRHPKQRFVFVLWEPSTKGIDLHSYRGFFNWTMTYRLKSHIIASYYSQFGYVHTSSDYYRLMVHENSTRKLNLKTHKVDHRPSDEILQKKKLGTAAALISNCNAPSNRSEFIKKLQRYIDVKVYGQCGESCPSNVNCREFIAENYYFILSFESSRCLDYTTEKFFAALQYSIIPVVLGRTNYSNLIPSSGYIDVNEFSTMISLAEYLNKTRDDKEKYLSYFSWKKDYVWGFNQFFTPLCDLCIRLHLDSEPNIIDDMQKWWFDDSCEAPRILP